MVKVGDRERVNDPRSPMLPLLCSLAFADARLVVATDTPVAVWVDGQPVEFAPGTWAATADDLEPGVHTLALTTPTGQLLYSADVTLPDNAEARTRFRRGQFALVETVALPVPAARVVETTARYPRGWDPRSARPDASPPPRDWTPPAPEAAAPVAVEFASIDGEWANVRVDGALVGQMRNADTQRVSVTLSPGVHTIEVRDFMDEDVWCKGQLLVTGTDVIHVGIQSGREAEVYNRPGAWRAI